MDNLIIELEKRFKKVFFREEKEAIEALLSIYYRQRNALRPTVTLEKGSQMNADLHSDYLKYYK
jgi:hypothetical protein